MKKILLTIVFITVTLMANALETKFFSVDFDKMELVQNGETYELLEVSKKELVNGRVVTYRCMDQNRRDAHLVPSETVILCLSSRQDW
ncbi:MAG: hypothetical protein J5614_06540 [Paludibacteraceae bacterium]|nr:hypothetical protein [Paludibacteraceae bacterium]